MRIKLPLRERVVEYHKMFHDYMKHVATLSTGCILIIIAFLEKLSTEPDATGAVVLAIISFVISIVSSVAAQVGNMEQLGAQDISFGLNSVSAVGMIGAWAGFLVGVSSLAYFGVINVVV